MKLTVKQFTEGNAVELCDWKYPAPYDIYNMPDRTTAKSNNYAIFNADKREKEFYAVYDGDDFVGFFRFADKTNLIMLGCGLRPDYCGKGIGKELISLIVEAFARKYGSAVLQLEVRAFNARAVQCYKNGGFDEIGRCEKNTPSGAADFIVMAYQGEQFPFSGKIH